MTSTFLLLCGLIFVAYTVGSTAGFGAGILSLTLGVHFLPLDYLVPLIVPLNVVLCTYLVACHHKYIDKKVLSTKILPLTLGGLAAGLFVYYQTDTTSLKFAYGCFVVLLAGSELVRHFGQSDDSRTRSRAWLLAGGFVQGLWVSGGPIVVYWANHSLPDKRVFRATLAGMWLVLNGSLFVAHLAAHTITLATLSYSAKLLPALALGLAVGEWLHQRLPERVFRFVVNLLLLGAGIGIIVRG